MRVHHTWHYSGTYSVRTGMYLSVLIYLSCTCMYWVRTSTYRYVLNTLSLYNRSRFQMSAWPNMWASRNADVTSARLDGNWELSERKLKKWCVFSSLVCLIINWKVFLVCRPLFWTPVERSSRIRYEWSISFVATHECAVRGIEQNLGRVSIFSKKLIKPVCCILLLFSERK